MSAACPLYGSQEVEIILNKPGFTFLIKYYNLLYQSLIPNSNVIISILKHHLSIPAQTETFLLSGENRRIKSQKILNWLLVSLDSNRDYKQFCSLVGTFSVLTDLPHRLIREFQANSEWERTAGVQPKTLLLKHRALHQNISTDASIAGKHSYCDECAVEFSALSCINHWDSDFGYSFTVHFIINDKASDDRADKCSINSYYCHNDRRYSIAKQHLGPSVSPSNGVSAGDEITPDKQLLRSKFDDILHTLPTDYEKTIEVLQDCLTDDQICDILSCSDYNAANKVILECLIGSLQSISDICDRLQRILPLSANPAVLENIIHDLRAGSKSHEFVVMGNELPQKLISNKDFTILKPFYNTILNLMPDNYELTIGKLQNYLSDDEICAVLSSSNSVAANKMILDDLIDRMTCREELLDFCSLLDLIAISQNFKAVICELRDVQQHVKFTSTEVASSDNPQLHTSLNSESRAFYEETFSQIAADTDHRILAVLKKNYTKLCHCLPKDYLKTIATAEQLLQLKDNFLDPLTMLPTADLANERIISTLIILFHSDALVFCDVVGNLSDITMSTAVDEIRIDILSALSYSASEHMVATDPVDSQTTTSHVLSDNETFGASHGVEMVPPSVESESSSHENISLPEPTQVMADWSMIPSGRNRDERPDIKDLHSHIIKQYAVHWEKLGLELGLKDYHIANISENNARHPRRVEECCTAVLEQWLRINPSPMWDTLDRVIKKITSPICTNEGGKQAVESPNVQLTVCMLEYQKHLKLKYNSLSLSSPEELLECSSSEYVSLLLKRFNEQTQSSEKRLIFAPLDYLFSRSFHRNKRSRVEVESLTLVDVLDVSGKKNKVILIEGGPGMGKSTLAIKMCKSWANGELLQEYDAVILLPLRDPEIQEAKAIKDLLLTESEELRDEVYKEIVKEGGKRVCFILEGFDELPQKLRSVPVFSKLTVKLPKCTLVYTSRPEACDKLRRLADHKIEICGFKEEQIDNYIKNAFEKVEDGEEKATKLISQVESNPTVKSILYVPINVAIICHLFFLTLQLPNTLTQLYTLLCLNLMLRHINRQNDGDTEVEYLHSFDDLPKGTSEHFLNLCLIAYKGRVDDRIIFATRDIKAYGIDTSKIIGMGLLVIAPSTSVYGREKSYNFLHLTLQEFCAALYISKLPSQEQLECFNQFKFTENFRMIWRFFSGITGLSNIDLLYNMLPTRLTLVSSHYRGRRTMELIHRVHEAQNDDVCQLVGSHLHGIIFLAGYKQLDVIDCTAVGYLLEQYRGEVKLINCRKCKIDDDCFRILVNSLLSHSGNYSSHLQLDFNDNRLTEDKSCSLITSLLSSNIPIVSLDMGRGYTSPNSSHTFYIVSDMGAAFNIGIGTTLCNSLHHNNMLKELHLHCIDLEPKHMPLLGQSLSNNNTLSVLDISGNHDMGSDGCQHLANVRNTSLSELMMWECDVGVDGADHIGKMLLHNKSITSINLSDNDIKDDGVKMLLEHLMTDTTLKYLDLKDNGITSIGAGHLSKLFTCNRCTVTNIILSNNPLGDEGVDLILQSITAPMELVGLDDTGMTLCSPSLCMALDKIKIIMFTPPDNCGNICDTLANTTVLEGLLLCGGSNAAHNTMITSISRNNSIKSLHFLGGDLDHQSVINLAAVIQVNKTITTIGIITNVSAASDYLLLSDAVAVNTSIKNMIIVMGGDNSLDKPQSLQFIKQLKHNHSLELLVFNGIDEAKDDDQFNRDVEMLVEEINYTRQHNGVTSLLYVNIIDIDQFISYYHANQLLYYGDNSVFTRQ